MVVVGVGGGTSAFSVCLITDLMSPGGSGCCTAAEDSDLPAPSPPEVDIHESFAREKEPGLFFHCCWEYVHLLCVLSPKPRPLQTDQPHCFPVAAQRGPLASKKVLQRKSNPGTPSSHGRVDGLATEGDSRTEWTGRPCLHRMRATPVAAFLLNKDARRSSHSSKVLSPHPTAA